MQGTITMVQLEVNDGVVCQNGMSETVCADRAICHKGSAREFDDLDANPSRCLYRICEVHGMIPKRTITANISWCISEVVGPGLDKVSNVSLSVMKHLAQVPTCCDIFWSTDFLSSQQVEPCWTTRRPADILAINFHPHMRPEVNGTAKELLVTDVR